MDEKKMDITDLPNNEREQLQTCVKCGKLFHEIAELELCKECQLTKEADNGL